MRAIERANRGPALASAADRQGEFRGIIAGRLSVKEGGGGVTRLWLGGDEQGEQREDDDACDHGGVISGGGLKAERQQARGAGSWRQGHGDLGPGNLGQDGGIDDGGLIAANRSRHNRAAVVGDKAEGEECAGKQETKDDRFRGVHGAVSVRRRGYPNARSDR